MHTNDTKLSFIRTAWPEDEIDTESQVYKDIIAGLLLRRHKKVILKETEGIDLLSQARIVKALEDLGLDEVTPSGEPICTVESVQVALGANGLNAPFATLNDATFYDLNYLNAPREEKAAVQVYLFGNAHNLACA